MAETFLNISSNYSRKTGSKIAEVLGSDFNALGNFKNSQFLPQVQVAWGRYMV